MYEHARVSVVIPTFNRSDLLPRAIDSVLAQSRQAAEIVVVDDCSTDGTPGVIDGYGEKIRSLRLPRNSERGASRNAGVGAATGDLVAFLDSDDEWEPAKLERQLELAPLGISVTGIRHIGEDSRPTGQSYSPSLQRGDELFVDNALLGSASSMLLPRKTVLEVGGFPTNRIVQGSEDWIFLVRLVRAGHRIETIPEPLVRYRVHPGSSTQQADNLARSMWWACDWMDRNRAAPPDTRAERRSRVAAAIATAYISEGRPRDGARWAGRALRNGSLAVRTRSAWRLARTTTRVAVNGPD